jgi:predicted metal-dependent HD superfamily phosphohydrolase
MALPDPHQLRFLKTAWDKLCSSYTDNVGLRNTLFEKICSEYCNSSRHYHNLTHISSMLALAEEHSTLIRDKDTVLFSIWFHDIVYNSLKKDNEEKSAEMAEKMLSRLSVDTQKIKKICEYILATKTHSANQDPDLSFFIDLDLSVLAGPTETYTMYSKNVRKEYKWVPGILYKKGRTKVLQHFLNMEKIFKTELFHKLFETKARENLKRELTVDS